MLNKWDKFFLEISNTCSKQSTCLRRQVGAVIVKDNRIISTGYNGAPSGVTHCASSGCLRLKLNIPSGKNHELCIGAHAEANAIATAAKHGTSIDGSVLYCTTFPCSQCAKIIINSGIKKVYYYEGYPDDMTKDFFIMAGIDTVQLSSKDMCDNCKSIDTTKAGIHGVYCNDCKKITCDKYMPIIEQDIVKCNNCALCKECY